MSRVRLAVLASILCLGLAAKATAGIPDPPNSDCPPLLTLVGFGPDGAPDPLGIFTVNVRNVPWPNATVALDFSGCPDIRVCADQHDPNVTVDCVAHRINGRANANRQATFRVVGFAANQGASPGSIGSSLEVFVGNAIPPADVYIGTVRVAALDQDGGGVNGVDLSLFLTDYFSG